MKREHMLGFDFRMIHNLIKTAVGKTRLVTDKSPRTQLQAGIECYLFHHQEQPVYQKHIEEEFHISGATATNTLQVMERNGVIIRSCMDKDARLKRIMITQSAMEDHMRMESYMRMMDQRMLEGISGREQAELFRLLAIVRENLEKMNREIDADNGTDHGSGRECTRVGEADCGDSLECGSGDSLECAGGNSLECAGGADHGERSECGRSSENISSIGFGSRMKCVGDAGSRGTGCGDSTACCGDSAEVHQ